MTRDRQCRPFVEAATDTGAATLHITVGCRMVGAAATDTGVTTLHITVGCRTVIVQLLLLLKT